MEPIRIIQTGDFHLDSLFSGDQYTAEQARQRRRDLRETFAVVMETARLRRAHLLLVTGDVFEHQRASLQTVRFIREQWAAQPDLQILVAPGNHDPAVPDSYYHHLAWSSNVHIFRQGIMELFPLPDLNLDVHGFGWTRWEQKTSCLHNYKVKHPERYNLLMFHGEVDGRSGSPYCSVSREQIVGAGFHRAAVGHIHQAQTYSLNGRELAAYAGSPEPLDFGETGIHGVLYGEVSTEQEIWEAVPLARREYRAAQVDAHCLQSRQQLAQCLSEMSIVLRPELLLRLEAAGPRDPQSAGDVEDLTAWLNDTCFHAEIRDRTFPDYDLTALSRDFEDTVLADFIQEMQQEMAGADPLDLPRLHKALQYGLAALLGRRGVSG